LGQYQFFAEAVLTQEKKKIYIYRKMCRELVEGVPAGNGLKI